MGIMQNKMGRPRKKPGECRSSMVTIRMNETEHKQLKKDAQAAGLSISSYLFRCWQEMRGK